jgi:peptide/nickel transport system permease protein
MGQARTLDDVAPLAGERAGRRASASWLRRLLRSKTAACGLVFVAVTATAALLAPVLAPYNPNALGAGSAAKPSLAHLLGQDVLGRDQLSRLMFGARTSLTVSLFSTAIGAICGVVIGLLAGVSHGLVDAVLMRAMDALLALPGLLLPLVLLAGLGSGVTTVSLALGIGLLPVIARLMRAQALSVMERDYVLAATSLGAGRLRIMLQHVAPNCWAPIIVQASLGMGIAVVGEAALSFLGVGIKPPTSTWGVMLVEAFSHIRTTPWLAFAPGAAIFLLVLSINFVGDALRDVLDPRLRGSV